MMQPSPTTSPATGENLWQATKKFWTLNTWFDLGFHLLLLVYYLQGQITATQVFLFYIMESMLIGAINFLRLVVAGYM